MADSELIQRVQDALALPADTKLTIEERFTPDGYPEFGVIYEQGDRRVSVSFIANPAMLFAPHEDKLLILIEDVRRAILGGGVDVEVRDG